jgi:hypothetical protein
MLNKMNQEAMSSQNPKLPEVPGEHVFGGTVEKTDDPPNPPPLERGSRRLF